MSKTSSIEVTEDQKNKIVDMFAKEKAAVTKVKVNLLFGHRINGTSYGPGDCEVNSDMVGHFQAADQNALNSRLKENESSSGMVEILGRGITRKVNGGF